METAHFWSATLDKSNREKQWASSEDEDVRTLSFSNIFLGEPSKAGEQNLVKLEFSDVDGEEVSCVLCVLQKGNYCSDHACNNERNIYHIHVI